MQIETDHTRPRISFPQMRTFMHVGWGDLGLRIAAYWADYNARYFSGKLEPIPIVLTNTSPYGHWLGCTHCNRIRRRAHLIQLTMPAQARILVADRGVLLHEMIHQHLAERGDSPKHDGHPWCAEIMRLHYEITGRRIWATPATVAKLPAAKKGGKRKSIRRQTDDPATGLPSLDPAQIATWPHSTGLKLGSF